MGTDTKVSQKGNIEIYLGVTNSQLQGGGARHVPRPRTHKSKNTIEDTPSFVIHLYRGFRVRGVSTTKI